MIGPAALISLLVAAAAPLPRPSPARVVQLRVEHLATPLGSDAARPRFSWQMADARRGARQSAYRILVASSAAKLSPGAADVWDSGIVSADSSVDVTYGGPALEPRRRYWWTVCIRDREGAAAPCAPPSWWETGKMGEPWAAMWIAASSAPLDTVAPATADTEGSAAGRVPLLRRAFRLSAVPVRARVYVTALGSYRLTVNGGPAGPGRLVPDWTDYRDRLTYQTYDVTRLLRRGGNAVGVVLGAGWYAGRMGYSSKRYTYGPPPVRLLLELHLTYADGHEDVIASDTSWRAAAGPILFSEIYDGEAYDARLEQPGWDRSGFDDRAWHHVIAATAPSARLQSQNIPPIERTAVLHPKRRWSPAPGTWVFDLGQNIAGWARLVVRGARGTPVRMRFAEILDQDGKNITQINLRSAKATDTYVLKGRGIETFEPHFTYHGFRYVEVTGFPGTPGLGRRDRHRRRHGAPGDGRAHYQQRRPEPALGEHPLDPARQPLQRADRLPAARRADGVDGRRAGVLADGELQHGHGRLRREMARRRARRPDRRRVLSQLRPGLPRRSPLRRAGLGRRRRDHPVDALEAVRGHARPRRAVGRDRALSAVHPGLQPRLPLAARQDGAVRRLAAGRQHEVVG